MGIAEPETPDVEGWACWPGTAELLELDDGGVVRVTSKQRRGPRTGQR